MRASRADVVLGAILAVASQPACQREVDCTAPADAGSLSLVGEQASATMAAFCDDREQGVEVEFLTVRDTSLAHLDLPCLCRVTDSIFVQDNRELVDLTGLSSLTSIGGGLVVERNPSLESLAGIPVEITLGATRHGESIAVVDNDGLVDLAGLPHANTALPGSIAIVNNERLASVAGLPPALAAVRGFRIVGNPQLVDLVDLPQGITSIGGSLTISANAALRDLSGLPAALERVDGTLAVSANEGLQRLTGVPAGLRSIGGDLEIGANPALLDLSGLPHALSVGGMLQIRDDDRLLDLSGLPSDLRLGVEAWTGDSLVVRRNDALLDLSGLPAGLTTIPGDVVIEDNASLQHLGGLFEHVDTIAGGLTIVKNHALVDLDGLPEGLDLGVDPIGSSLVLADNDGLERLSGFPASLTALPGSLGIARNRGLRDLTGLSPLRHIAGDLVLGRPDVYGVGDPCDWELNPGGNAGMLSLAGLDELVTVGGSLAIVCNPALQALDAFAALRSVGGDLLLVHNSALADITGLGGASGSLTAIGGVYQVLCSPLLDPDAALGVLDQLEEPVMTTVQLMCE